MRIGPLLILLIFTASVAGFAVATAAPDPVYRVASGSMAPTLLGPHYPLTCEHCQFSTMLDAQELPKLATCPNCGYQENPIDPSQTKAGQGLMWQEIELDQLERWDIVLLEDEASRRWQVKRVAFLPGESPKICRGELYRGSQVIHKSPRQREALKQLVFDQSHDSPDAPRFVSQRPSGSGWNVRRGSLGYAPVGDPSETNGDWLIYHHQRCLPPPSPVGHDASPLDSYGYNHSVSRELFPVADLWLEFTCDHWQAEGLTIRLQEAQRHATIHLDLTQGVVRAESLHDTVALPLEVDSLEGMTVRAGECDGQLFLELEGGRRHRHFPLGPATIQFGSQPFALKMEGGQAIFRDAKIYRDIVWLGGQRRTSPWSLGRELDAHEIFVVGDNVPVSADSRFEMGPVNARNNLRGKVLRVQAN